jgi:hypothetical protein
MPLHRGPQPGQLDVTGRAAVVGDRFAVGERDPRIATRVPEVQLPPRAVLTGGDQCMSREAEQAMNSGPASG